MNRRRLPTLPAAAAAAAAAALALLAAGCGSSSGNSNASGIQPAPSGGASASAPATDSTPTTPANPALAKKPSIATPTGPAPTKLVIRDLVKGTGPAAAAGQTLSVQYVGVLYKNGKQFDSSWDRGQPFSFTLGTGGVIAGWDQGLLGMHVGGRRQLVIPAALAYGPQSKPANPPNVAIPANSPLVFDVDLLAAQ